MAGNGFPAVAARGGIELPAPDGRLLFERTWHPAGTQPLDTHSPSCRCRACGSWDLSAPPAAVVVPVLATPAPAVPAVPAPVPVVPVVDGARTGRPVGGRRRSGPARLAPLACTVCGVGVDPAYAARTGQVRHGSCRRDEPALPALAGAR